MKVFYPLFLQKNREPYLTLRQSDFLYNCAMRFFIHFVIVFPIYICKYTAVGLQSLSPSSPNITREDFYAISNMQELLAPFEAYHCLILVTMFKHVDMFNLASPMILRNLGILPAPEPDPMRPKRTMWKWFPNDVQGSK